MRRFEGYIVGAPGSGKSKILTGALESLRSWIQENGVSVFSYKVDDKADVPLGVEGDFYSSLAVFFAGEEWLREARSHEASVLTTSNIFNSLAHIHARMNMLSRLSVSDQTQQAIRNEMAAIGVLVNLYQAGRHLGDDLNLAWYAPLPPDILIPGQDRNLYDREVDSVIRDMNTKLGLGFSVLEGTPDEQVEMIVNDIKQYAEHVSEPEAANVSE